MEALELVTESGHSASMDQRRSNLWINLIDGRWRALGNDSPCSGKQWARGERNAFAFLSPQKSPFPERSAFICWQKPASTISHSILFPEVLLRSYLRDLCWFVFVLFYFLASWNFLTCTGSYSPAEVINFSHTKHSGDFEGFFFFFFVLICSCTDFPSKLWLRKSFCHLSGGKTRRIWKKT